MNANINLYAILFIRVILYSNLVLAQGKRDVLSRLTTLELVPNESESKLVNTIKKSRSEREETFHAVISADNKVQIIDKDIILFPDQISKEKFRVSYTREEAECFNKNQVFYNGSCAELLSRQHCREGEWLVLDLQQIVQKPSKIVPKCQKNPCMFYQFYWRPTKTCYNLTDVSMCPRGNKVNNDMFGYGACECEPLHRSHGNGICYGLYTQGPCQGGEIFVENTEGKTECVPNLCGNSSLVKYKEDNKCYVLGTPGEDGPPCQPNFNFTVSEAKRIPECVSTITTLVIPPPTICPLTNSDKCAVDVQVETPGITFITKVSSASAWQKGK